MNRERQLAEELAHFGKLMHDVGFVSGTDGNLSVRLDEETVLATPTCISKGMMQASDMVMVDMQGRKVQGERNVSSEIGMHLTIYRMRSDVAAITHAHPCTATGFAAAGIALDQPICSELVVSLGAIPLASYATPGSADLSESLRPFIPDYDAILMANHGVVSYGRDLEEAYLKMETVEHFAKIMLVAHQLGGAQSLSKSELRKLLEARTKYEGNRPTSSRPAGPVCLPDKAFEQEKQPARAAHAGSYGTLSRKA